MGQPARDPADLRYVPARLGGIGAGFTRGRDKASSPAYLQSLSKRSRLSKAETRPAMDVRHDTTTITRQAVRAKARLVSLGLLDRIERDTDSMDTPEVAKALGQVAKLAGVETVAPKGVSSVNIGTLHLAALKERAALRLSNGIERRATLGATEDAQVVAIDDVTGDNQSPVEGDAGDGDEITLGTA